MNSTEHFEMIVSQLYEPLFRFALSLTRLEADARDLTQHTFHVWATNGHQLRDASKVKTWLFTTLHRAFLAARRRQARFPQQDLEDVPEQLLVSSTEFTQQADCSEVLAALGKVDEVYRAAVALFYLEDCAYKEIAAVLEVPIGTVKSRIARGIAQLRKLLAAEAPHHSSAHEDGISPTAGVDREHFSDTRRHGHTGTGLSPASQPRYQEWDLSSTIIPELIPG